MSGQVTESVPSLTAVPSPGRRWILPALLLLAAALRLPQLASPGYTLDELWTAETATGRGSLHLALPTNRVLTPPEIFALTDAPRASRVWSHMEVTHPPFYYLTLRVWMDLFGQADWTERFLSVLASLAAVALLFDVVRRVNGRTVAVWACLLMIVASPQIDFARKTRNYAVTFFTLLAVADAVVRIGQTGPNRRRIAAVFVFSLLTALTHYFTAGALLGLAIYAAIRLRGSARRRVMTAFAAAGVVFLAAWGPFFWKQRPLFDVSDPGVSYVHDLATAGHIGRVVGLLLMAPATLLVARVHLNGIAYVLALLFIVPVPLLRRRPDLLLWWLWLVGTLGVVAALDLCRSSLQLGFVRYELMASSAVFVLIPALALGIFRSPWPGRVIMAGVLAWTACYAADAYTNPATDPNEIVAYLAPRLAPSDVIVFASVGDYAWTRGVQYMMVSRYIRPIPCPVIFLDGPPTGDAERRIRSARNVVLFTSATAPSAFITNMTEVDSKSPPAWGQITIYKP